MADVYSLYIRQWKSPKCASTIAWKHIWLMYTHCIYVNAKSPTCIHSCIYWQDCLHIVFLVLWERKWDDRPGFLHHGTEKNTLEICECSEGRYCRSIPTKQVYIFLYITKLKLQRHIPISHCFLLPLPTNQSFVNSSVSTHSPRDTLLIHFSGQSTKSGKNSCCAVGVRTVEKISQYCQMWAVRGSSQLYELVVWWHSYNLYIYVYLLQFTSFQCDWCSCVLG